MPVASDKGGADYELIPASLHLGVCYAVIDLGTHYDEKFKYDKRELCLIWELPNVEKIEIDGVLKPRVISKRYTLSLGDKANLRKDLESWRGKAFTEEQLEGFDLGVLVTQNCQLQVIHKKAGTKTYANINTIVNVAADHVKVEPFNPVVVYDIGHDIPEDLIPDWIVKIIKDAQEWKEEETESKDTPPDEVSDVEPF